MNFLTLKEYADIQKILIRNAYILEQVIPSEVIAKKEATEANWSKIDEARKRHQGQTFSDSVELLREDRNR